LAAAAKAFIVKLRRKNPEHAIASPDARYGFVCGDIAVHANGTRP
jgi:hypothetical protein